MYYKTKTEFLKVKDVVRNWYVVNAADKILGRLSTQIAKILMGKDKVEYTPNVDCGDHCVVINAAKIKLTGKKLKDKLYYRHSGYLGGLKVRNAEYYLKNDPTKLIYLAVKRMLPDNRLRARRLRRLHIYFDHNHPHSPQKPQPLDF